MYSSAIENVVPFSFKQLNGEKIVSLLIQAFEFKYKKVLLKWISFEVCFNFGLNFDLKINGSESHGSKRVTETLGHSRRV